VDNSLQHGGPNLGHVRLSLAQENGVAIITVEDDGNGLRAEDVEIVLARFGQASPGEGSGLGLSIAEAVAERHCGTLELQTERQGLLVRLSLPMVAKTPQNRVLHQAEISAQSRRPASAGAWRPP
jgi:two-component system sensor histidine kinase TctE